MLPQDTVQSFLEDGTLSILYQWIMVTQCRFCMLCVLPSLAQSFYYRISQALYLEAKQPVGNKQRRTESLLSACCLTNLNTLKSGIIREGLG